MKIIKTLEESGLLIKDITEKIDNEVKKQKGGFLAMLLYQVHKVLEKFLSGKDTIRGGESTTITPQDI